MECRGSRVEGDDESTAWDALEPSWLPSALFPCFRASRTSAACGQSLPGVRLEGEPDQEWLWWRVRAGPAAPRFCAGACSLNSKGSSPAGSRCHPADTAGGHGDLGARWVPWGGPVQDGGKRGLAGEGDGRHGPDPGREGQGLWDNEYLCYFKSCGEIYVTYNLPF